MGELNDNLNPPNHDGIIPTGTRIELRVGVDHLYKVAEPGWRAVVRDRKQDDDGFEMVYVEWDREYWRYKPGQSDGWAFPNHFNIVGLSRNEEPEEPEEKESLADTFTRLLMEDSDECPGCGERHTHSELADAYMDRLADAAAYAGESEGFALIFIKREDTGEQDTVDMIPHFYSTALTEDAAVLLEAQIIDIAQNIIQRLNLDRVKRQAEGRNDE